MNEYDEAEYRIRDEKVYIEIPAKNKSKFRWKQRTSINDYGGGFAMAEVCYSEKAYVEWQMEYDILPMEKP